MLDIVIPIYNEEEYIDELMARLRKVCPEANIIFVDNGSTDGTLEKVSQYDVEIVRHKSNEGYGKSLMDGINHGKGNQIVTIDADLEYPPESIPDLLKEIENTPIVYGSRFLKSGLSSFGWFKKFGNLCLTQVFNILYNQNITDLYTGIKAFKRDAISPYRFMRPGFEFVVEFIAYPARRGIKIGEVPVKYHQRKVGKSKMRHFQEVCKAIFWVVSFRILKVQKQS